MSRIRYSQCWEDPEVLQRALQIGPTDDVLSIASAGDNTLALLLDNPRSVTAVDMNPAQLHLLELKMRAIEHLEYTDFVSFLGARPTSDRMRMFQDIATHLSAPALRFWEKNSTAIERGVIHCGKLERYLTLFRRFILPKIHGPGKINRLLSMNELLDQEEFYESEWNTAVWRALFRLFFCRTALGGIGRERSFFRHVDNSDIGSELLARTKRGLTQVSCHTNYFLEYMLTGQHGDLSTGPPYLREENFAQLRRNVSAVSLHCSDLTRFLWYAPTASYSRFNLSDILEYLSLSERDNLLHQLIRVSRPYGRTALWTLFVPQDIPVHRREKVREDRRLASRLWARDRGFFYGAFHIWCLKPVSATTEATKSTQPACNGGTYA